VPNLNRVTIEGHLGKDPVLRHTPNGVATCSFSIGISEGKRDDPNRKTEWVNVVLWKQAAEKATNELKKGDAVHIEGKLQTRSWEKDGKTQYMTEVVAWTYWARLKDEQVPVTETSDESWIPF